MLLSHRQLIKNGLKTVLEKQRQGEFVKESRRHQPLAVIELFLSRWLHVNHRHMHREQAGAIGGFLSGSGSSIICVTLERSEGVAAAMKMRMPKSEVKILTSDNSGFRLAR